MLQALNPKDSSVLLVEDNPDDALIEKKALQQFGIKNIHIAGTGEEALGLLSSVPCDVVVVDYNLPGMDGLRLIERIRQSWPDVRVLMISGLADPRIASAAMKAGAGDYVSKDSSVTGAIFRSVQDALRERQTARDAGRREALGGSTVDKVATAREEIDWLQEAWFEGSARPAYESAPEEGLDEITAAFARYMLEAFRRFPEASGAAADAVARMLSEREASPGEIMHCYRTALVRVAREQPAVPFSPAVCLATVLALVVREYQVRSSLAALERGAA